MKKSLLLSGILFFAAWTVSFGQIQVKFLDNEFGDDYSEVKENMSRKGFYSIGEYAELEYRNVRFGGYEWDFCTFTFNNRNEFFSIDFSIPYNSKDTAIAHYEALKNRLVEKYGTPAFNNNFSLTDREIGFQDNTIEERVCLLSIEYTESELGIMFYYVTLSYCDLRYDTDDDEL